MESNEVLFCEQNAAAQSLKSFWTRLASTYGCMMIVLYSTTLIIKPHWFSRWIISLLRLDQCHEIPITNIISVTEMGRWSNYGKVELHFHTMEGEDKRLLLFMKKSREFVDNLPSVMWGI